MKSETPDIDFVQFVLRTASWDQLVNSTLAVGKCILDNGDPNTSVYNSVYSIVITTTPVSIAIQLDDAAEVRRQISILLKAPLYGIESSHRISVGQILISLADIGTVLRSAGVTHSLFTMIGTRQRYTSLCAGLQHVLGDLPVALDVGMCYNLHEDSDSMSCFSIVSDGIEPGVDVDGAPRVRPIVDRVRTGRFSESLSWDKFPLYAHMGQFKNGGFKFKTVRV